MTKIAVIILAISVTFSLNLNSNICSQALSVKLPKVTFEKILTKWKIANNPIYFSTLLESLEALNRAFSIRRLDSFKSAKYSHKNYPIHGRSIAKRLKELNKEEAKLLIQVLQHKSSRKSVNYKLGLAKLSSYFAKKFND